MTVRRWIIKYVCWFLLPLFAVIFCLFSYMISNMTKNSATMSEKTMELYISRLEENLRSMERILLTIYDSNVDLSYICVSEDSNRLYMSKIAFANYLNKEILIFDRFDGMFGAVNKKDDFIFIAAGGNEKHLIEHKIGRMITGESTNDEILLDRWYTLPIGEEYYLLRITKNGDAYCGAWLCLDYLAEDLAQYSNIGGAFAVVYDGARRIVSGKNEMVGGLSSVGYLTGSSSSRYAELQFDLFMPTKVVLHQVRVLILLACFVVIGIVFMLILFWKKMKVRIIYPSIQLCEAMGEINTKDLLPVKDRDLFEFNSMKIGFNEMKQQIRKLKIEKYEQEIKEQKIHMQYLFGQMQPHFFLNTLNVMYSFAEIKRYDLIQQMILAMVRYLRYVFNNGARPVALKDEISHVEDFITIQKIRYPGKIDFKVEIDDSIMDVGILPFLLQTFVENSIKYGLQEDKTDLYISAICVGENIEIVIRDSGRGFTAQKLYELNKEEADDSIYEVGVRNTKQRLKIMYQGKAQIEFSNHECGGAVVKIIFPVSIDGGEK